MEPLTCLIFTAIESSGERSGSRFVWARQPETNRAWYFPVPLTNELEDDVEYLPLGVVRHFQQLPAAHYRSDDGFAFRLGIAQMEEEELDRDWIAAPPLAIVFREPKDECDWDGVSIDTE
jgi:hypothetical protein